MRVLIRQLQCLLKPLLQALKEKQRAAEEHNIPFNFTSLRQTGNRLIDNSLKNRSRHIFFAGAFVEQWLYITLCKDAAARCDGINALCLQRECIQFIRLHIEQHGHLVNKSARTTGTGAIHSFLQLSGQEHNFCILAAQFNDHIRLRHKGSDAFSRRKNFLYKVYTTCLCHTEACRAGNCHANICITDYLLGVPQHLTGFFTHLREMPLIFPIQNFKASSRIIYAGRHEFYGC